MHERHGRTGRTGGIVGLAGEERFRTRLDATAINRAGP
jgi:hypothetical protein